MIVQNKRPARRPHAWRTRKGPLTQATTATVTAKETVEGLGRRRRDGEGRAAQRERILDALFEVVSSSGTLGASVTEIAEAAGIARGALHYYFESKEELKGALMRRLGERYVARLAAWLDRLEARPLAQRPAHGVVGELCRFHFADPGKALVSTSTSTLTSAPIADDAARLLAVWIDYWGQAPSNDAIGAVVFGVQEEARALCARALLADRPELRGLDDDALRLAGASILAVIEGGLLQWRIATSSSRPLERAAFGVALARAAAAVAATISVGVAAPTHPVSLS